MATTKLIYPYSDAFTSEVSPDKNFGGLPSLYTGVLNTDKDYKTLIYFDISQIPANSKITKAVLKLYLYRNQLTADGNISIKKLDSDFIEYSVDANTALTSSVLDGTDPPTLAITTTTEDQFIEIILTDTVTAWYVNGNSNHGIEISGPTADGDFIGFWSKEYYENTLHPRLEIQYEEAPTEVIQIFNEEILPEEAGKESRKIDNSDCLDFTYYVTNPSANPSPVNVQLRGCDTLGGTYYNIGGEITVNLGKMEPIYINVVEKYVQLLILGQNFTGTEFVDVVSNKKGYEAMMSSSSVYSAEATIATEIELTMTKDLITNTPTDTQFAIDINSAPYAGTITVAASGTTITITLDAGSITAGVPVTVSYTPGDPSTNTLLTGPNGNVAAFTDQAVTNNV